LVFIPFCYVEAAANVLTDSQLNSYGKIPEFKYYAARIEPTQGIARFAAAGLNLS